MSDVAGKAYAITVFTPMKPFKTPILRAAFLLIERLGIPRKDQQNLVDLSFIHFARWVVVSRHGFPRLSDRQPAGDLEYDYLLFCSNFNGSWEQYIDAFSAVIPGGMNNIWRWSERYPGSRPITPFLSYIAHNQVDNDYFYNATPGANTTDILRALKLQAALEAFIPASSDLAPTDFAAAFDIFFATVQNCLGSTGPSAVGVALDTSTSSAAMDSPLAAISTSATRSATANAPAAETSEAVAIAGSA